MHESVNTHCSFQVPVFLIEKPTKLVDEMTKHGSHSNKLNCRIVFGILVLMQSSSSAVADPAIIQMEEETGSHKPHAAMMDSPKKTLKGVIKETTVHPPRKQTSLTGNSAAKIRVTRPSILQGTTELYTLPSQETKTVSPKDQATAVPTLQESAAWPPPLQSKPLLPREQQIDNRGTSRTDSATSESVESTAKIEEKYDTRKLNGQQVTLRLTSYQTLIPFEVAWECLRDAMNMLDQGADVTIMLDREGVRLANKHNLQQFQVHRGSSEKLIGEQQLFQDFLDRGGHVLCSERWAKAFGIAGGSYQAVPARVQLLSDDDMSVELVKRRSQMINY